MKRVRRYSGDACVLSNLYLNERQFSYLLQGGDIISGESYRVEDKSCVAFFQNFFQVAYDGAGVRHQRIQPVLQNVRHDAALGVDQSDYRLI